MSALDALRPRPSYSPIETDLRDAEFEKLEEAVLGVAAGNGMGLGDLQRFVEDLKAAGYTIAASHDVSDYHRIQDKAEAIRREQEKAAKVARALGLMEYHGAIRWCQAGVANGGRSVGFHRCQRAPKTVIRVKNDPNGDGRLAVCKPHGSARFAPHRHRDDYYHDTGANEVVEPEYQPGVA